MLTPNVLSLHIVIFTFRPRCNYRGTQGAVTSIQGGFSLLLCACFQSRHLLIYVRTLSTTQQGTLYLFDLMKAARRCVRRILCQDCHLQAVQCPVLPVHTSEGGRWVRRGGVDQHQPPPDAFASSLSVCVSVLFLCIVINF